MHLQNLLRYWRHCLADGELSEPPWRSNPEIETTSLDALIAGKIDPTIASRIVDRVEARLNRQRFRSRKRKEVDEDRITIESADIAVTPFRLRRIVEHGQSRFQDQAATAPFWIAARLNRNGQLSPTENRAAWFVRAHLDPSGRSHTIVGTLDAMDTFLAGSPPPADEDELVSWSRLIQWIERFFDAVTGSSLSTFALAAHERVDGTLILAHSSRSGAGRHLLGLYDALLHTTTKVSGRPTLPPLIQSLVRDEAPMPVDPTPALDHPVRDDHLGHMTNRFGLGLSQRESLHALLQLPAGKLLALNGPPGTGKTAWIQSVVASLWIERALAGGEPPIIVATSSNNRAVTNILDTFDLASPPGAPGLDGRWLPNIDTYGLFLPSSEQSERTEYRWAAPGRPAWQGLPQQMEDPAYLGEASKHYLERAKRSNEAHETDIEAVVEHLRSQLAAARDHVTTIRAAGERLRALRAEMTDTSPVSARERVGAERQTARSAVKKVEQLAREVDKVVAAMPMAEELLAFLPPIRDRRNQRFVRLFQRHDLAAPTLRAWRYRPQLEAGVDRHRQTAASHFARAEERWRMIDTWEQCEAGWRGHLDDLVADLPAAERSGGAAEVEAAIHDPLAVEPLLDRTLRRRLFLLAGRYWEGRWILELRTLLADPDPHKLNRQSRSDCLRRFRRFAMVTPLFVSTVYMLPKFFDYYERGRQPLVEAIDLLVVEEAGQVAPELGGVLLGLAQRAVLLGDVFQIEPVWNIGRAIDDANRERHDAEAFRQEVFHSSRGSLMGVARARSHATTSGRSDGLWLREHRRCVPGVIAYCKRLVSAYRDVLEPKRPEIADRVLPALGWAHIQSASQQTSGSWSNPDQASAVANWIAEHQADFESAYGKPLDEILGVVTPYRAQIWALRRGLDKAGIEAPIDVGTVHTFQGGERPVMLFSSVVTSDRPGPHFFDRNVNLLNVAVSRAQDSFLVFGDMRTFDPAGSQPSGILASFLFAEESNELPGIDPVPEFVARSGAERISGLKDHRRVLREAFEQARKRLLIVSPYLTARAVDADRLLERIAATRASVSVAYSVDMAKPEAEGVADRLHRAGADVIRLRGFHTKTLAVDDAWFTHGSFNWLSAVRVEGRPFQYQEASIRCGPPTASAAIPDIWGEIEAGRIP